jgi:hypothetical protein
MGAYLAPTLNCCFPRTYEVHPGASSPAMMRRTNDGLRAAFDLSQDAVQTWGLQAGRPAFVTGILAPNPLPALIVVQWAATRHTGMVAVC